MQYNQFSGNNDGTVIQARDIHIHECPPLTSEDRPLIPALHRATVKVTKFGTGRGVCIAPNKILTAAELVPHDYRLPDAPSLAVVPWPTGDRVLACLHQAIPPQNFTTTLERLLGSPVLNRLTGAVCAIVTSSGTTTVPDLDLPLDHRWLDLLTPAQLAEAGWRHLPPDLREYLRSVRAQGDEHEYGFDGHSAPNLRAVYLTRWATPKAEDDESDPPKRVDAEQLLTTCAGAQILGEAGMGKSSLVRYFAAVSADRWLRRGTGQAVPVPVTARALACDDHMPDLLARGVRSTTLAQQRLVEMFSAPPLPGVPWLVLVDGLDELIDTSAQQDVVQQILRHRKEERYRFVLTSRHFGNARFDQRQHPTYVLSPFGDEDLRKFISTWFREEGESEAAASALFTRLRTAKLYELAHVPLIATMLCALACAGASADLPPDETGLYEQYVQWQLGKVVHSDVRTRLREWQARSGAAAEQAADTLLGELRPLLQEMAHAAFFDQVRLLDFATARYPDLTAGAVREALLASGLVLSSGEELQFRHETIKEFLAACHLFDSRKKPRRLLEPRFTRREWPDLKVMLFLTALVAKEDPISGPLLRAMWWPFHRHHMEFIAELAPHGVDLDHEVRARAVRVLSRNVQSSGSDGDVWRQNVDRLRKVDPDAATWLLRDLIERPGTVDTYRQFEAVRYLIQLDARTNEPTVLAFLRNPDVQSVALNSVHNLLNEVDPELDARIFTELAGTATNGRRLQAATIIFSENQAAGFSLLKRIAVDDTEEDQARKEAIEFVDGHDSASGLELWRRFMLSAHTPACRTRAMDVCFDRDREGTTKYLADRLDDKDTTPPLKFAIAQVLVSRKIRDPSVLFDLATESGLTVDERVAIATRYRHSHQVQAAQLVDTVLQELESRPISILNIIMQLQQVSPKRTVNALVDMTKNADYPEHIRFRAARRLPRREKLEAFEYLASITSFSEDGRMKAAKEAFRDDATVGMRIYERIIQTSADDETTVRLAIQAKKVVGSRGDHFLNDLAIDTNLSFDAHMTLIPHLGGRQAVQLLHRLANTGPTHQRMHAAKRMISVGGAREAAKAYQAIANARGMSKSARARAQAEADRLSEA